MSADEQLARVAKAIIEGSAGLRAAGRLLDGREWNEAPPAGESV